MTLIICPACNTRFETPAVIPPSGRKVRCSKCGNVWQATPVIEPAKAGVASAPTPPMQPPRPTPMAPRPGPTEMRPAAPLRPASPEPRPAPTGLVNTTSRFPGAPGATGLAPKPTNGPTPGVGPAPAAKTVPPRFGA